MQTPASENLSLHVSVASQTLEVRTAAGGVLKTYPVSTSRFGLGSEPGSLRTPLGAFRIAEKFGENEALGTIFKSREPTGEIGLGATDADLVLTRILWLEGVEEHNASTRERYIYIHGTNHEGHLGQPASHGCVRMSNADIAELYELVPPGTDVRIFAD
jgi:lipoprotein-anchoring transpeptidase ErfK/SrfK